MLLPVPLGPSPGEGPRAPRGLPPPPREQEKGHGHHAVCPLPVSRSAPFPSHGLPPSHLTVCPLSPGDQVEPHTLKTITARLQLRMDSLFFPPVASLIS